MSAETPVVGSTTVPKLVGIVLFDQVELLDFAGPVEVLWTARLQRADGTSAPTFEIVLLAEKTGPVRTAQGVEVIATASLEACPPLDVLLIPGGWGTRAQMKNEVLLDWIRRRSQSAELTTSVCTGALVLGAAGLLSGRRATTHWGALELLRSSFPLIEVVDDEHVVRDGGILTSAGVAAGIDLALRLVAHYLGDAAARDVAQAIEYPYPEDNARRINRRR